MDEWKETQKEAGLDPEAILELIDTQGPSSSGDTARAMEERFTAHVQLPSREEMEKMLMERRKKVRNPRSNQVAQVAIIWSFFFFFCRGAGDFAALHIPRPTGLRYLPLSLRQIPTLFPHTHTLLTSLLHLCTICPRPSLRKCWPPTWTRTKLLPTDPNSSSHATFNPRTRLISMNSISTSPNLYHSHHKPA